MRKRSCQRYSAEFKEQALGLLRLGKPVPEVAAGKEAEMVGGGRPAASSGEEPRIARIEGVASPGL